MMRKMMMGTLLFAALAMQAETVILKQAVPQKNVLGGTSAKEIKRSETVTKDKAVCTVISTDPKAKLNANSYQAWCAVKTMLKKGRKYRVSCTLTASADCSIGGYVCMMWKPWTSFAPVKFFKLTKNKPQNIAIEFTASQDFNGVLRAPAFALGLLKSGQSVAISNLLFIQLD